MAKSMEIYGNLLEIYWKSMAKSMEIYGKKGKPWKFAKKHVHKLDFIGFTDGSP